MNELNNLVGQFEYNIDQYKGKSYDEAKTRADFIDKFFHLLGWDIYNAQGYSEQYREVVREDKIPIKGKVNAPDYCFRIGNERKFFVEAKKPAVDIKHDITPAFQLRRYAYTAKLPLSILTDFEEFAIYDTRIKPDKNDGASTARIFYCTYKEYNEQIDFISQTFSREAILKGSFDKYIEENKGKKGTSEVDKEFLKLIEIWREDLAKNIALRNKDLSIYELNYVVQAIIDRIIFLRIAEDRQIETYGQLQELLEAKSAIYPGLVKLFYQADGKYNSGLFDFQKDTISTRLVIDDRVFRDIIKSLYYPDSPYEFSVFDVEILGNIYEQFLGKTIRLTASHQAKVEDKPEVKKAGGVYYTPKYIVDYIVRNTVGEKIKDKKPEDIAQLKILDPACGSGSFLLGAYRLLLDYHLNYYTVGHLDKKLSESDKQLSILKKAEKENRVYVVGEGEYRLTFNEKRQILANNIFGVDIDRQAVEVTKLSLLLKLLEGESGELKGMLIRYSDKKLLPDLSGNIKSGNSLIGSDFYEQGQMSLFRDEETVRRINVFDWQEEFSEIFKQDGFDVVIGNPPYGAIFVESTLEYLKNKFETFVWRGESYLIFVEQAVNLLEIHGLLGYIIPDTYLNLGFTQSLRTFILQNTKVQEIVALPSNVFNNATVDTTLFFTEKNEKTNNYHLSQATVKVFNKRIPIKAVIQPQNEFLISTKEWFTQNAFNVQSDNAVMNIINRIDMQYNSISHFSEIFYGIKAYQVGKGKPPQTKEIRDKKPFTSEKQMEKCFLPFYDGKHIDRYILLWKENNWINYGPWLAEPRYPEKFEGEKILIRKIIGKTLISTYVPETSYCNTLLFVLKIKENVDMEYLYLLGLLNSTFIGWYFRKKFQISVDDIFPQIMIRDILKFAIPYPPKNKRDIMVEMVDQMLDLHKKQQDAKIETEKNLFKKQIQILDRQIDQLVYQLYQLSDDEIKIIEEDAGEKN